jgi:hypothetical protein
VDHPGGYGQCAYDRTNSLCSFLENPTLRRFFLFKCGLLFRHVSSISGPHAPGRPQVELVHNSFARGDIPKFHRDVAGPVNRCEERQRERTLGRVEQRGDCQLATLGEDFER